MTGRIGTGAVHGSQAFEDGQHAFGEALAPRFESRFTGTRLHSEQSAFQMVEVFDHVHFGRTLVLDGLIQTTELDEFCYHEMLVHPVLTSVEPVGGVLVIGGGDGGTLRHVLMHGPERAVMCEIDEAVVRVSREHLPGLAQDAFDDPRAELVIDDGAAYVAASDGEWDAIVVDSTDPIGAATVLFSDTFYESCRTALRPGGVLVTQSGSPLYQLAELSTAVANLASVFETVEVYLGNVPTYPGVLWSYTCATDGAAVSSAEERDVSRRLEQRGVTTRYYNAALHGAGFRLPSFVHDEVVGAGARGPSAPVS